MQPSSSRARQALTLLAALTLTSTLAASRVMAQDDDTPRVRSFSFNRARIGVSVGTQADKDNDKIGARVQTVTPDGPADKAGLKAGDVITRFNGKSLAGAASDDDEQSGPGRKLVELAQKLDAGDSVEVEYRRGSDNRKATIVAQDMPMAMMGNNFKFEMPDGMKMRGMNGPQFFQHEPGSDFRVFVDGMDGMRGGLDLVELTPELGEYFGTKSGVLVLRTPRDSSLALKAGDVITAIDGRTPTSESQVHRILQSYDGGEIAKIEVLRKQKKVTISWKVPEVERGWSRNGEPRAKGRMERS